MAKQNTNKKTDDTSALDVLAKKILSTVDPGYTERTFLNNRNDKFRVIMDKELELSKGISQGSIVDFVSSVVANTNVNTKAQIDKVKPDSTSMFTKDIGDIFGYFQDLYKNRFIEMTDLKFISKFIPALGEAVRTTLDAVVSSDDISATINRSIQLPTGTTSADISIIMGEIERFEKELTLLPKLKNVVYKKALVTGQYYVYAISYDELFAKYDEIKKTRDTDPKLLGMSKASAKKATEAVTSSIHMYGDIDMTPAFESLSTMLTIEKKTKEEITLIENNLKESLPTITINQGDVLTEALEGMNVLNFHNIKNTKTSGATNPTDKLKTDIAQDGTKSPEDLSKSSENKFSSTGTYIKYIDSKNIIPIRVLDNIVIGYYVIHPTIRKKKTNQSTNGLTSMGSSLFSTVNVAERKKEDAIANIVDTITNGILNSFSSKFTTENSAYKKLIGDCIIANGIADNDYNIQFIPAENIFEFKINENEDGYGESILSDSLFPAKSLLNMIVIRMLNYINKTGNKTIAHIYKGPIDVYTNNQLNRVVQDLQESNITFNDLLSPNLVFNKFNKDANIALPTTSEGKKLVEFETQEGQNIDMNPEYENKLEQMAIMGTGVPSVIMDFVNSADFAKQITSANIKFAGRTSTLQSDLEEPSTQLYRYIIKNSALADDLKNICISGLTFKLPKPKVLINGNNSDFIRTIVECAQQVADSYVPQDTDMKNAKVIRSQLMLAIVKENAPFFNWTRTDEMFEDILVKNGIDKSKKDDGGGM